MKIKNIFLLFACCILVSAGFTACSSDDELGSSDDLVGTWEGVTATYREKYKGEIIEEEKEDISDERVVFGANGKYTSYYYSSYSKQWRIDEEGTWSYKKGKLYLVDNYDDESMEVVVEKLTSSTLVLTSTDKEDGFEYYYNVTYRKISDE